MASKTADKDAPKRRPGRPRKVQPPDGISALPAVAAKSETPDIGAMPGYTRRYSALLERDIETIHNAMMSIIADPFDKTRTALLCKLADKLVPSIHIADKKTDQGTGAVTINIISKKSPRNVSVGEEDETIDAEVVQ